MQRSVSDKSERTSARAACRAGSCEAGVEVSKRVLGWLLLGAAAAAATFPFCGAVAVAVQLLMALLRWRGYVLVLTSGDRATHRHVRHSVSCLFFRGRRARKSKQVCVCPPPRCLGFAPPQYLRSIFDFFQRNCEVGARVAPLRRRVCRRDRAAHLGASWTPSDLSGTRRQCHAVPRL